MSHVIRYTNMTHKKRETSITHRNILPVIDFDNSSTAPDSSKNINERVSIKRRPDLFNNDDTFSSTAPDSSRNINERGRCSDSLNNDDTLSDYDDFDSEDDSTSAHFNYKRKNNEKEKDVQKRIRKFIHIFSKLTTIILIYNK